MIIKDLFSHKIHSSEDSWQQKLIDIATVFSEFDGQLYDRGKIEKEFIEISPRASLVSKDIQRDPSKYRDEISAYPAYLGLYKIVWENNQWVLRMSETARKYLISEEPNVPAFLLLQLILFQYPNSSGIQYSKKSAWIVHNARDRTLAFINQGVHLSPFRLICKALLADSRLNGINSLHPNISIDELSVLCNDPKLNSSASPSIEVVVATLEQIRNTAISPIEGFERRLHLLNHTDFLQVTNGRIHLREAYSPADSEWLINTLNLIATIEIQFGGFDDISNPKQLNERAQNSSWANYYDGLTRLSSEIVQAIAGQAQTVNSYSVLPNSNGEEIIADNQAIVLSYPLRERGAFSEETVSADYYTNKQSDPEVTRIRRQKSNLMHKIIVAQLDEHLRSLGAKPKESEHIDLYAEIPNDGSYLFEVKSISSENLLSQTRKGLSQLYEYRYRYDKDISDDVILCLVYPYEPKEIDWLQEYLCQNRNIAVLWFENEKIRFSSMCKQNIHALIPK